MGDKSEKKKIRLSNVLLLVAVALILASGTACCFFFKDTPPPPPPPPKVANVETAKELLLSVANGSVLYSGQHGGNGKTKFPRKASDIADALPPVVARALEGCTQNTVPADGYVCRLIPVETETNFLFEASPADGYTGEKFIITRELKVWKKGEQPVEAPKKTDKTAAPAAPVTQSEPQREQSKKITAATPAENMSPSDKTQPVKKNSTVSDWLKSAKKKVKDTIDPPPPPPPPIRPAKQESAAEMLQSVYHASKLYSAEHGGNGQAMFPTKPTQIAELVPQVIKKSIVFLRDEEDKAVPIDGYIMIMYPAKTQNPTDDFCFVAYPAKYFTGPHFEITKLGKIKQISPREGE